MDLDDIDVTKAESKATYQEIKDFVEKKTGLKVSNLDIAQVKRRNGIIERKNYNFSNNEYYKQPQCSEKKEEAILESFRHFEML